MIPNPWVLLGIALAWAASLAGVGYWQHNAGVTSERVFWQAKENTQLVAANAEIQRLNDAARKAEHDNAATINAIGVKDAQDREALEAQHRDDLARVRAGTLRLRVAGGCKRPGPSSSPEARPAPAGGDDSTTGELPAKTSSDLFDLTADADRNTKQLTACQAIVDADRKAVNGP